MTDMRLRGGKETEDGLPASGGVTYWYYAGVPLFPFGHGLSYSRFEYSWSNSAKGEDQDLVSTTSWNVSLGTVRESACNLDTGKSKTCVRGMVALQILKL